MCCTALLHKDHHGSHNAGGGTTCDSYHQRNDFPPDTTSNTTTSCLRIFIIPYHCVVATMYFLVFQTRQLILWAQRLKFTTNVSRPCSASCFYRTVRSRIRGEAPSSGRQPTAQCDQASVNRPTAFPIGRNSRYHRAPLKNRSTLWVQLTINSRFKCNHKHLDPSSGNFFHNWLLVLMFDVNKVVHQFALWKLLATSRMTDAENLTPRDFWGRTPSRDPHVSAKMMNYRFHTQILPYRGPPCGRISEIRIWLLGKSTVYDHILAILPLSDRLDVTAYIIAHNMTESL